MSYAVQRAQALLVALGLGLGADGRAAGGAAAAAAAAVAASGGAPAAASPLRARLQPLFERQRTDTACSLASATIVINALRQGGGQARLSQAEVVALDASGAWARATADAAAPGVTLDQLAAHLTGALRRLRLPRARVQRVYAAPAAAALRALTAALAAGEAGRSTFVVLNFVQDQLTPAGEAVGHMSVVGQYDAARERLLVLDVDPTPMPPYWASLAAVLAAMGPDPAAGGRSRGFLVVDAGP